MLETNVVLLPNEIGENITKNNIRTIIVSQIEGKCCREGYVKPNTIKIIDYTSGIINGKNIIIKSLEKKIFKIF